MLIHSFQLEVFTPPCSPGSETHVARLRFDVDISDVLPYLNGALRNTLYQPEASALSWKDGKRHIVFHAHEINISNLDDRAAAEAEAERIINLVNETWMRRNDLKPDFTARKRPAPMELFKLLPQTNCRKCGEPTCFCFALKLATGQAQVYNCPPLSEPQFAAARKNLESLI